MTKKQKYICDFCGKEYFRYVRNTPVKYHFCSRKCHFDAGRTMHLFTRTGRQVDKQGYVLIFSPDYPHKPKVGGGGYYVPEHRLVVEKALGRYLTKKEIVHHKNGIKSDNRLENLEVVTRAVHYGEVECPHCHNKFLIK